MKKTLVLTCLIVLICVVFAICLFSCGKCDHDWVEATCANPRTCSICGATEGEPTNNHTWMAATCIAPSTCTTCGLKSGGLSSSHNFDEQGRCGRCSKTSHQLDLGHYFNQKGVCSCGELQVTLKEQLLRSSTEWAKLKLVGDDYDTEKLDTPVLSNVRYEFDDDIYSVSARATVHDADGNIYASNINLKYKWSAELVNDSYNYTVDSGKVGDYYRCDEDGVWEVYYYTKDVTYIHYTSTDAKSKARVEIVFTGITDVINGGHYLIENTYDYYGNVVNTNMYAYQFKMLAPRSSRIAANKEFYIKISDSSDVTMYGYDDLKAVSVGDTYYFRKE